MATGDFTAWARLGAIQRLSELEEERAAILAAFPDLRQGVTGVRRRGRRRKAATAQKGDRQSDASTNLKPVETGGGTRKRRTMSPEARKKIAAAQRRRWRKVRAAAK